MKVATVLICILGCWAHSSLCRTIDSGGGIVSEGQLVNHVSVGSPFATDGVAVSFLDTLYGTLPALGPNEDSDGNGLPDAWEIEHFGHFGVNPLADDDFDGANTAAEYTAGTNPNDSKSVFSPSMESKDGALVVRVSTLPKRNYEILGAIDLKGPSPVWTLLDTLVGDGSTFEWMVPLYPEQRQYFLKIRISIPSQ